MLRLTRQKPKYLKSSPTTNVERLNALDQSRPIPMNLKEKAKAASDQNMNRTNLSVLGKSAVLSKHDPNKIRSETAKMKRTELFDAVTIKFLPHIDFIVINTSSQQMLASNPILAKYNTGLFNFSLMYINTLTYNNPSIQITSQYDISPVPHIEIHMRDMHEAVYVDCTGKSEIAILKHLQKGFGQTPEMLRETQDHNRGNPDNYMYMHSRIGEDRGAVKELFGTANISNLLGCVRDCMCRGEGQFPCMAMLYPHAIPDKRTMANKLKVNNRKTDPYGLEIDYEAAGIRELEDGVVPIEDNFDNWRTVADEANDKFKQVDSYFEDSETKKRFVAKFKSKKLDQSQRIMSRGEMGY